ncbi:hypothetical protein [Pseudonocardia adelaidensis]|uniref:YbaB/EbfC DNA-binding family protein n=1 Tax=Pseudonocardia adelaidensis TaxID=648754 RepID=A0ABP9N8B5_9PSEU
MERGWPLGRYSGEDPTGRVHVALDGAARDATVVLEHGWRSAVGTAGLAAAVLQAFCEATTARLVAWASADVVEPAPPGRAVPGQAGRPTIDSLSRARRDLREFRQQLMALRRTTETASSPGRLAVARVSGGQVTGLELDPEWLRTAASRDLERHVGHALRGALTLISAQPERALASCPDLAAFLAGTPFAPFSSPHSR